MPDPSPIDVVRTFALALDHEDYAAAIDCLDPECIYTINDDTHRGPDAIVASYKGNGDAASRDFDAIEYGSDVRRGDDDWIIISFWDHLTRNGHELRHTCEQWARVNERGLIHRIEHHDLPGERERLAEFRALIAD